jgi:hypothetical protein
MYNTFYTQVKSEDAMVNPEKSQKTNLTQRDDRQCKEDHRRKLVRPG